MFLLFLNNLKRWSFCIFLDFLRHFFIGRHPEVWPFQKPQNYPCVCDNRTCGQGIDCQDCYKNSRLLVLFFEKLTAWIEFWLRKGFTGSGSLLPKSKPSYGSVGIKLPEIIAATLRHLASLWKITKISGPKELKNNT